MTIIENEYMPYLIRIAVLFIIAVSVFDFIRRRAAVRVTSLLRESGAVSPDSALHISVIKEKLPRAERLFRLFLREGSMLRRIVACKESDIGASSDISCDKKKKTRTSKKPDTDNSSWYLICDTYSEGIRANGEKESPRRKYRSAGALGRKGADTKLLPLIIGILLTVIAGELLVHFLPDLAAVLAKSGYLF